MAYVCLFNRYCGTERETTRMNQLFSRALKERLHLKACQNVKDTESQNVATEKKKFAAHLGDLETFGPWVFYRSLVAYPGARQQINPIIRDFSVPPPQKPK